MIAEMPVRRGSGVLVLSRHEHRAGDHACVLSHAFGVALFSIGLMWRCKMYPKSQSRVVSANLAGDNAGAIERT